MKIKGIEFDIEEVEFDRDGRLEKFLVYVEGSDQELSDVLTDKVLSEIEMELYRTYEGPEMNEDDPREDR